jgi:tetratricopeptide (TPR) repeat protein
MDGGRFGQPHDYFDNARMLERGRSNDRWKQIMTEMQRRRQLSIDQDIADLVRERHIRDQRRKAAAEYTPEKIKALHEVATTAIERKDYKNADQIYNNILVHVEDPMTLLMLAFLRMQEAHRYDDALAMYERLLELDPGNPYGLLYSSWLTYLLDKSLARKQSADKRIVDLLRQSPRKNLRALLDFIEKRHVSQSEDAIVFLSKTMQKLPSDLLSKSDIRKMRSGIEQHIELFKKRSMPNYTPLIDQSDEITDEFIQDDPDDPDELELEGYDD